MKRVPLTEYISEGILKTFVSVKSLSFQLLQMSNSKVVDNLIHQVQVYICAQDTFLPAIGHVNSTKLFQKINDVYVNKYEILMARPVYSSDELENHLQIGEIYTLERLLLAYLGCHGSLFQPEKKRISGSNTNGIGILNDTNFENEVLFKVPPEDTRDYSTVYIDHFIDFLASKTWTKDYYSYVWLHNKLSKMAGAFHGIGRKGASPFKQHQTNFHSRYLRGVLSGTIGVYFKNLKRLKTCIESQISMNKFNVFEVQGFHLWIKAGAIWFLNIETYLTTRYGNEIDDLRKMLENISPNIIRFNSIALEQGQCTFASLLSDQDSNQSPSREISIEMFDQANNLAGININDAKNSLENPTNIKRNLFRTSTQDKPKRTETTPSRPNTRSTNSKNVENVENIDPMDSDICLEPSSSGLNKNKNAKTNQKTEVQSNITTPKTARRPPGLQQKLKSKNPSTFQTPKKYQAEIEAQKKKLKDQKSRKAANKLSQKRYLNLSESESSPEATPNKKKR